MSSWKSNDPEEAAFIREYPALSDRTVGLLAVALVERRLKMAIKGKWIDSPKPKLLKDMFAAESGQLGSFGAQIDIGYAIGLYDWEVLEDLKNCAKIRNLFAHRLSAKDFDSQRVRDRCKLLKLPDRYAVDTPEQSAARDSGSIEGVLHRTAVPDIGTPRGRFARAVELAITLLWVHLGFPQRLPVSDDQ